MESCEKLSLKELLITLYEVFQVLLKPTAISLFVVVLNRKVIPFLFQMLNMHSSSSSAQNVASGERNVLDGALQSCV